MSNRTTHQQVEGIFSRFCSAYHLPIDSGPGSYALDYAAAYGGWKVIRYTEHGGEDDVFGATRRSSREMWDTLYFAIGLSYVLAEQSASQSTQEDES